MKILTVSGYKPMELNIFKEDDPRITFIKSAVRKRLLGFIEDGLEWVLISGQMGVELWTAEVVFDLQEEYDIKLAVFPPFENQESRWPDNLKEKYEELQMMADFYKPLYEGDYKGPYQFRAKNLWFIDKSEACLLVMNQEFPGSNKYFHEAIQKSEKAYGVFIITPEDLEEIVEELRMEDPGYWE